MADDPPAPPAPADPLPADAVTPDHIEATLAVVDQGIEKLEGLDHTQAVHVLEGLTGVRSELNALRKEIEEKGFVRYADLSKDNQTALTSADEEIGSIVLRTLDEFIEGGWGNEEQDDAGDQ